VGAVVVQQHATGERSGAVTVGGASRARSPQYGFGTNVAGVPCILDHQFHPRRLRIYEQTG
jgi:hypothetical protein